MQALVAVFMTLIRTAEKSIWHCVFIASLKTTHLRNHLT